MLRSMSGDYGAVQMVAHNQRVLLDVQGIHWACGPKPRIRDHATVDLTTQEAIELFSLLGTVIAAALWPDSGVTLVDQAALTGRAKSCDA